VSSCGSDCYALFPDQTWPMVAMSAILKSCIALALLKRFCLQHVTLQEDDSISCLQTSGLSSLPVSRQRKAADKLIQVSGPRVETQSNGEYQYFCKQNPSLTQYYSNCSVCVAGPICCEISQAEESAVLHSGGRSCNVRRSVGHSFCASQRTPTTCKGACPVTKHGFVTPAFSKTGRVFPYWTLNGHKGIDEVNTAVQLVFIVFHGFHNNDGDRKACYLMDAVRSQLNESNQRRVLVVAPQFYTIDDKAPDSELTWAWGHWRLGEESNTGSPETVSSFLVMDEMMQVLVNSGRFPNLRKIKLVGFSAGGQFVQRYAAFGQAYVRLVGGPSIEFVVASPNYLSYFDMRRPVLNVSSFCRDGGYCHIGTVQSSRFNFEVPSDLPCGTSYHTWPYGVAGSLPFYFHGIDLDAAIRLYRTKKVTYFVGNLDTCNGNAFSLPCQHPCHEVACEGSCQANQQGLCRHMRLHAWFQYLDLFYKGDHRHTIHDSPVGHSPYNFYKTEIARLHIVGTDTDFA